MIRHHIPPRLRWLLVAALAASAPIRAEITIGSTYSVSGANSAIGLAVKNTMEVLPDTVGGQPFRIIALDDAGQAATATGNMRKMTDEDKVDVVIGGSSIATCIGLADIAAAKKTAQICLAPAPIRNPWIFSVAPSIPMMVNGAIEHMRANGVKTVAYIGFSDNWGDQHFQALLDGLNNTGIKVITNERYARTDTTINPQILKVIASGPTAVFVGAAGPNAALPSIALAERGYKGRVYHSHAAVGPEFLKSGGKTLEGVIAPTQPFIVAQQLPDSNPVKGAALEYAKRYQERFGAGTLTPEGAYLWDAYAWLNAAVPVAMFRGKPGTPEFREALRDALENLKDVVGTHAVYSLGPDNHIGVDRRGRVMVRVEKGAFRIIP